MVQVSAKSNICSAQQPSGRAGAWIQAASALLLGLLAAGPAPGQTGRASTAYLTIAAVPLGAGASERGSGHWAVYLDGEFDQAAPARLARFVVEQRISQASVYFNSPGGSLVAAMTIGRLLREQGFSAHVGRRGADPLEPGSGVCYSACPFAYAGGSRRFLDGDSVIGIHRAANRVPVPDEGAFEQRVAAEATAYLRAMGVSTRLFRMMQTTPHDSIRLLSREEATRLGLVNAATPEDQNPRRARAFETRDFIDSDFIGNERKKSSRVSAPLRARTFAAQDAARASSPAMACAAAAIIAISTCAPGERAARSAHCAASVSSPSVMWVKARVPSIA
jgi:hypothetical protein